MSLTFEPEAPDVPGEVTPGGQSRGQGCTGRTRETVTMTEATTPWLCPKDATAMEPMGRRGRGGAYRCPACKGIFLDVEAMRSRRKGQPPKLAPVVSSIVMSLLATFVVRRLLRRRKGSPSEPSA